MTASTWQNKYFNFSLPLKYHLSDQKSSLLIVLLHGYQDRAESVLKRLGWQTDPPSVRVLAINAPFPAPKWTPSGFVEAYSWYFRDTDRKLTLVPPSMSARAVVELMAHLGLAETPKVLVGFSQGGYLAPFIASQAKAVRAIVAMGSSFPSDSYKGVHPLPVYALHGAIDEIVPIEKAKREHSEILSKGFTGEFRVIDGLTHKVDPILSSHVMQIADLMLDGK